MMKIQVWSIPMTNAERATWPKPEEICPRCERPFGAAKKRRLPGGVVIHNRCAEGIC